MTVSRATAAPPPHEEGEARLGSIRWPVPAVLTALLGYVAVTVFAMWPAFKDLSGTIMGSLQPSDATAGGTWTAYQIQVLPPFASHTPYMVAPQGAPFWDGTWITKLGWLLPQWFFVEVVGAVGSWNLALALGFILDGMAMFGLTRWLTGRAWVGFVAGLLYAFSPFHVEESYAHIGYVYSFIFPLILWAGLALLQRPTATRALVFGVAVGVAGYFDGYYLLFAPLMALLITVAGLVWARRLDIQRVDLLRRALVSAVTAFILTLPVVAMYIFDATTVGVLLNTRSMGFVTLFSARILEYLVPGSDSILWGWLTTPFLHAQLHNIKPIETTLYLSIVVIVLALMTISPAMLRFSQKASETNIASRRNPGGPVALRLPLRFLGPAIVTTAVVLLLCSFAWFGPVPGFPIFIFHLKPYWRAFSRLDVAVDCCVVTAAALTLAILSASRLRWLAPLLAILAVVDGTPILPWASWSFASNTPAPYQWLATHPDGGIVVNYPLPQDGYTALGIGQTFQPFNHHPLFDGSEQYTPHGELEYGLADITDPQTVPTLRRLGVRYIELDRNLYRGVEWRKTRIRGVQLLVSKDRQQLYRIEPGPITPAALTDVAGVPVVKSYLPKVIRYMTGAYAVLGIDAFKRSIPLRISLDARSWLRPRTLTVQQNGAILWRGMVGTKTIHISFTARTDSPLHLHCRPGGVRYKRGYHRSVDLTSFQVRAGR